MKTLVVTASSKSKRRENETPYLFEGHSFVDKINKNFQETLFQCRRELRQVINMPLDEDIGDGTESSGILKYLPAHHRYAGRTYSRISSEAWENLKRNPDEYDCVILSALYGLIRYNEPIQDYLIKQVDKLPDGRKIGNFWKQNGASEWLLSYIQNNNIDNVEFVLSTSYSDIIKKDQLMTILKDDYSINSADRQFKEAGGMKSMLVRGQYINDLFLNQH